MGETGPRRTITVLNAAAGIYAANVVDTLAEGIALAETAIDSGAAYAKLQALVEASHANPRPHEIKVSA